MKFKDVNDVEFNVNNTPIIDDEMVARAVAAFAAKDGEWTTHEEQVRTVLEAALGLTPAYPITEAMMNAGNNAWDDVANVSPHLRGRSVGCDNVICAIYTAMRNAEEKK